MRLRTSTDVGAAIRAKRRALGLDQASLAKKVGVSRQWVIEIERGKPRAALRLVLRTLEALGVVLRIDESTHGPTTDPLPSGAIDLDAVLRAHREPRTKRP
jgi:y4mF family transcriptional regulator